MPQVNSKKQKRKAGQAITRSELGKALLIGGGIGAGTAGIVELMKQMSPKEQQVMVDEALIAQEEEGPDATTFGVPAASILTAGVVLESMNRDMEERELQALSDVTIDIDGRPANYIRRV